MTRKSKEEEREYQKKYYDERIKNDEEARERKNARQREYAKRTGYAANAKSEKNNTKRYVIKLSINTDKDIIDELENKDNKTGFIKQLIREEIKKNKKSIDKWYTV